MNWRKIGKEGVPRSAVPALFFVLHCSKFSIHTSGIGGLDVSDVEGSLPAVPLEILIPACRRGAFFVRPEVGAPSSPDSLFAFGVTERPLRATDSLTTPPPPGYPPIKPGSSS